MLFTPCTSRFLALHREKRTPQHANGAKSITKDRGAALQPYLYRTKMVLPEQIVNWP